MEIKYFENNNEFIEASVSFIKKICAPNEAGLAYRQAGLYAEPAALSNKNIGLSGGSTPRPIYEKLASLPLNFEKIHFYQVDERAVPHDHPESNHKMIKTALAVALKQHPDNFHFFHTELPIEKSLENYADEIKNVSFDLCILGMGTDGHIASLFPHSPAILENKKLTAHTFTENFAVKDRLTITFPPIMRSKKILLLLKGIEKKAIIEELLKGQKEISELPAKKLLEHDDLTIYFGNY